MPKLIYQDSTGVERSIVLGTEPLLIGRSAECQVQTQDAMVSRRHARIFWDGGYLIEDLGSSNGVYVGQDKVQKAPFRPGDIVTCGSLVIRMVPDMRQPTSSLAAASLAESNVHNERTPPPAHLHAAPHSAPQMPPPVAAPQPTMAVPAVSAPSLPQTSSPSVSTGRVMGDPQDLVQERARREQAEQALLLAAKKTEEYEGKIDKLKVHIEQLTAEVRREKRNAEDAVAQERNSRGMVEAERDQLRRRMLEMESHPAFAQTGAMGSSQEVEQLRLENERLNRELRRAQASQGGGAEIEQQLQQLRNQLVRTELDRDQALRQLSQQSRGGGGGAPDPAAADAAIALNDALVDLRSSLHAATDEATMLTAPADSVGLVRDSLRSATEQLEAARVQLRVIGKSLGVA